MRLPFKNKAIHAIRVSILLWIACLMRAEQNELLVLGLSTDIDVDLVAPFFPSVGVVQPTLEDDRVDVLDEQRVRLGYVIQTSPKADHVIGFSGPTNTLIAFSSNDTIVGLGIISSGDTRDHVHQVRQDVDFLSSLNSLTADEALAAEFDAVSGATLTSHAIAESIALRLGSAAPPLRFPEPPGSSSIATLFPSAVSSLPVERTSLVRVFDKSGAEIGTILRTSPAADHTIGYQGPTEAYIGFNLQGTVIGVVVGSSYDNDPYVDYVRQDMYFLSLFNDNDLDGLARIDLTNGDVEGVSGATMTSVAVVEGIVRAAAVRRQQLADTAETHQTSWPMIGSIHDVGTIGVVVFGVVIGLTHLRAKPKLMIVWRLVLIVYLGWIAGSLLSQAMFVGWAAHGVPFKNAVGLVCLAIAALCVPIVTRRNIYCSHLCPHGAAQQILRNRLKRIRLPGKMQKILKIVPALFLLACVVVGMNGNAISLVDIEPFHAYVFRVAGWATVLIAIAGLVASLFVPMAYCRYGCPTGALLGYLRFNARSDQWAARDWVAAVLALVASVMRFL